MIHNLQGIHETVDYKADTQICLYYNDEAENYPPHWHPSFEVIMPVINDYRVVCGYNDYQPTIRGFLSLSANTFLTSM